MYRIPFISGLFIALYKLIDPLVCNCSYGMPIVPIGGMLVYIVLLISSIVKRQLVDAHITYIFISLAGIHTGLFVSLLVEGSFCGLCLTQSAIVVAFAVVWFIRRPTATIGVLIFSLLFSIGFISNTLIGRPIRVPSEIQADIQYLRDQSNTSRLILWYSRADCKLCSQFRQRLESNKQMLDGVTIVEKVAPKGIGVPFVIIVRGENLHYHHGLPPDGVIADQLTSTTKG